MPRSGADALLRPVREWGPKHWIAAVVAVLGLAVLIESAWVTDAEAIEDQTVALGAAMEDGDIEAAVAVLSHDFEWGTLDREQMRLALQWVSTTHPPTKAAPSELDTTIDGDTAASEVMWHITGRYQGRGIPGTMRTKLKWRRTELGWRCQSLSVNDSPLVLDLLGGGGPRKLYPKDIRKLAKLFGN